MAAILSLPQCAKEDKTIPNHVINIMATDDLAMQGGISNGIDLVCMTNFIACMRRVKACLFIEQNFRFLTQYWDIDQIQETLLSWLIMEVL